MDSKKPDFSTIDEYIAGFPEEIQKKLREMRQVIKEAAPDAQEKISYQVPTYFLHGNLVHFAGYKKHIGFYPAPSGLAAFQDEISKYPNSKGAVQFPLDQPLPIDLVKKIVVFRVRENMERQPAKKRNNF